MPDDTITLVSTTDSPEEVQAALTNKPVEKPAEKPAAEPAEPAEADAAEAAAETPEQAADRETREASEAGRQLAKRKNKIQEQIDTEIRRKHEARLDAEAEEARLMELRRQRQELEAAAPKPPEKPAKPAMPTAEELAPLGRAEPKLDALGEDGKAKYATYEDYLSDHAVWTREEAILAARKVIDEEKTADRARIERESTSRVVNERLASYNDALEVFKKTHVDFDAVFQDAKEAVQETLIGLGPNALKVIDGYTVFDAEDGPALTYYLLQRPDELKAIAMKAPPQQLVALARLEKEIRPAGAKRTGPPAVAAVKTSAPAPIKPVGSGPTATTVSSDEESFQDYKARRNRELRARQGL
jgi:hypothetical protein